MTGPDAPAWDIDTLAAAFTRFSEVDARGSSALYEHLAARIAEDPEVLGIAASARRDQVVPYVFFGAVQFLLLQGTGAPLARYYPGLAAEPLPQEHVYPAFRGFCLENEKELRYLLETKRVQTNEVGRSTFVLPCLAHVALEGGDRPLGLVEVGASAGLNLFPDRYFFDYGRLRWGDAYSGVRIACRLEGELVPPLATGRPTIIHRAGIDISPINVFDEAEVRWLRATVWPEHRARAENLVQAVRIVRQAGLRLLQGDAAEVLPLALDAVPPGATLCVFQTYALNQFPPEGRERFYGHLARESRRRDVYFVSTEGPGNGPRRSRVEVSLWRSGERAWVRHACDGEFHGAALRWHLEG